MFSSVRGTSHARAARRSPQFEAIMNRHHAFPPGMLFTVLDSTKTGHLRVAQLYCTGACKGHRCQEYLNIFSHESVIGEPRT